MKLMKKIRKWWRKKKKEERRKFIFRCFIGFVAALLLMNFGALINFTLSGSTFSNVTLVGIGVLIGYVIGKNVDSTEEDDDK